MFNKSLILATVAAALATPVLAQTATVTPGAAMQAKILGVDPTAYSLADLARLAEARSEGDSTTEQAILNKAVSSGFESKYFVDGSTLSSDEN